MEPGHPDIAALLETARREPIKLLPLYVQDRIAHCRHCHGDHAAAQLAAAYLWLPRRQLHRPPAEALRAKAQHDEDMELAALLAELHNPHAAFGEN